MKKLIGLFLSIILLAAKAFTGIEPEIMSNQLYLNQQIDIHE